MLTSREGAQVGYDIRPAQGGMRITAGTTGGVNGKSPVATCVANLADLSERSTEPLALYVGGALPLYLNGATLVATADGGTVTLTAEGEALL
jgi:hypothetical protein